MSNDTMRDGFREWCEAVLSIAGTNGMPDDQVIPTWPEGVDGPELTIGMIRAALSRQPESEPVGEALGCSDPNHTIATFDADKVPVGAKLYTRRQQSAQVPTPAMIAAGADKVTVIDCAETVAKRVYLAMRSADTTPQPAALPEGWKLVPAEPTENQIKAINWQIGPIGITAGTAHGIYCAALTAAPSIAETPRIEAAYSEAGLEPCPFCGNPATEIMGLIGCEPCAIACCVVEFRAAPPVPDKPPEVE